MSDFSKPSLSLLDLLTCGLGGVLLMFMVLLITARQLDLSEPIIQWAAGDQPESPFLILATTELPAECAADGESPPQACLRFEYDRDSLACRDVSGTDHAIVYARRPPTDGKISLHHEHVRAVVDVRVYHHGQRVLETKVFPNEDDPKPIWPPAATSGE